VSTIGFAAGGALLAVGVTVYLTTPRDRTTGLALGPTVTAHSAGGVLAGQF
jgi:hypothetical protein